jgi:glyoxylase-like metal-dependent hydrolase (beta-lactamase superfamily II)
MTHCGHRSSRRRYWNGAPDAHGGYNRQNNLWEDPMHKAFGLILAAILGLAFSGAVQAANDNFRVTLLGTGSPDPDPNRFSASTLIEAGDQKLLIDVGRGATIRLYQLHVPLSKIDVVFFTHYHSDHTIGLPDLLLTGWLPPPSYAHRTAPLHVMSGRCQESSVESRGRL